MLAQEKQVEVEIIPVIDLLDGCVVHAQRGQRSNYRPISTPLCDSSKPLDIVEALLKLYPFTQLYIADLDAIQHQGNNVGAIHSIRKRYPQLGLWLDGGFGHARELQSWQDTGITCVLGSENLASLDQFVEITRNSKRPTILSLDFGAGGYMGPAELLDAQHVWPERVILMTLMQVGSNLGPDLQALHTILNATQSRKPALQLYAAGGIRDQTDVTALKEMGAAGALVATALHNGSLAYCDIAGFAI